MSKSRSTELVLKQRKGWQSLGLGELWHYRELLAILVWRDIKIRYRQTFLGATWAILQPLAGMLVFTFFFHEMAGIQSGSGVPYPIFAYAGMLVWTFFANAVAQSSTSLIGNQALISKIYFPRTFVPLGAIGALVLDMLVGLGLVLVLQVIYQVPVTANIVVLPLFMVGALMAAAGTGFILAALSVRYRDVKYVVPFIIQMGLFLTPVIYPVELVERYPLVRQLMGLNPMAGMVEGFRYCLLGSGADWGLIGQSLAVALLVFVGGMFVFRRWERDFADII